MRSFRYNTALCSTLGTALAVGITPTSALAQEADQSATDEIVTRENPDERVIVVTAQRRAQDRQDVPAAVTALAGNELENRQIVDVEGLQGVADCSQCEPGFHRS